MSRLEQAMGKQAGIGDAEVSSLFRLPRSTEKPEPKSMELKDSQPTRIYLVDEELIVLKTLQGFLADLGYQVRSFFSAGELLAYPINEAHSVNVILMDLNLPEADGVKLVRDIHQRYADTDLVIMTGHRPVLPLQEAISNGVYGYLNKPIRLGELELMLIRLSESRSKSRPPNGSSPAGPNGHQAKD